MTSDTPRERKPADVKAAERLGVQQRAVERLIEKVVAARLAAQEATRALREILPRLEYAADDPDLSEVDKDVALEVLTEARAITDALPKVAQ